MYEKYRIKSCSRKKRKKLNVLPYQSVEIIKDSEDDGNESSDVEPNENNNDAIDSTYAVVSDL